MQILQFHKQKSKNPPKKNAFVAPGIRMINLLFAFIIYNRYF